MTDTKTAAWTGGVKSLGFAKAPADTRVVAAMSGGVDSSVVAAMLKAEGYDAHVLKTEFGSEDADEVTEEEPA